MIVLLSIFLSSKSYKDTFIVLIQLMVVIGSTNIELVQLLQILTIRTNTYNIINFYN